jgi:hypothetical protein
MTPNYRPVDAILHRIKSGKSESLVKIIRDGNIEFKKRLPCVLFGGTFTYREISAITQHSGFINLDFDKFGSYDELMTWRDTLESNEYVYSVWLSPSGKGLKALVKIPVITTDIYKNNKAYFRGLQVYFDCEYFDKNMFDISRICFESYDPDLTINENSQVWTGQIFDPQQPVIEYGKATLDEQETVRRLLVWWNKKYGINNGNRNSNLFKLCITFSDYGIDYDHAFSIVSGFNQDDFKIREITTTINSAYKRGKNNFGKLSF